MLCKNCLFEIEETAKHCVMCKASLHDDCANKCLICGDILCDDCFLENKYKCKKCLRSDVSKKIIRRSYLAQYELCPYSYMLQAELGVTPPMGKAAQLGVFVHDLIECVIKKEFDITKAKYLLLEKVEQWNDKHDKNDEYSHIDEVLATNGLTCLEQYNIIEDSLREAWKTEYKIIFEIDKDLPKISCTLDKIVLVDGEYHIEDWKTGKALSGQKLITDLQPALYMYAVYKEFGKMPKSFTLHYLRENKSLVYERIDDDTYLVKTSRKEYILKISDILERAKKILSGIANKNFKIPEENKIKWYCERMCWFGHSGKCKQSFQERWRRTE